MNEAPELHDYEVDVDGIAFTRIEARALGGSAPVIGCVDLLKESVHSSSFRLLHVHTAFRGMGIGALLVEECCKRAKEWGCKSLGLEVDEANELGRDFYRSLGFVEAYRWSNTGQSVFVKLLDDPKADTMAGGGTVLREAVSRLLGLHPEFDGKSDEELEESMESGWAPEIRAEAEAVLLARNAMRLTNAVFPETEVFKEST